MSNYIKLIKNNDDRTDSDIEKVREFYNFLIEDKGNFKLSNTEAFAIIYYLQENLPVFPDSIEMCNSCEELFESPDNGIYLEDKGIHLCNICAYEMDLEANNE